MDYANPNATAKLRASGFFLLASVATFGFGSLGCCGKVRGLMTKKSATGASTTASAPRGPAGPQAGAGPVTIAFNNSDFTVSTGGRGRVLTFSEDGRLMVTVEGLPIGTKVQAGPEEVTISRTGSTPIKPDIKAALGAASTEPGATFDPKVTLTITLPDGRSGNAPLPAQRVNSYSLGKVLQEAAGKGVSFEGEAADNRRDTAFLSYGSRTIGRKGLVRDIDMVVTLAKGTQKGTKNCSGYKSKDGTMRSVTLELFEGQAVAFDRRTGAEIARKTLPPNTTCPMTLYQAKDDPTADSNLPGTAAEKWAKTLLK